MSLPSTPTKASGAKTSLPAGSSTVGSTRRISSTMSLPSTPTQASSANTNSPAGSSMIFTPSPASKNDPATKKRDRLNKALKANPIGASVLDLDKIIQSIIRPPKNQGSSDSSGDNASTPKNVAGWIAEFIKHRDVLQGSKDGNFNINMKDIKWFLGKAEFGHVIRKLFDDERSKIPLPKLPPPYLPADKALIYFKDETSLGDVRRNHTRWAPLNVLFVVYRILGLLPSRCVTGAGSPDFKNAPKILGLHPEDWTRGLCLLKFAIKDLKRDASQKSGQPTTPKFFTSEDKVASTSTSLMRIPSEDELRFRFDLDDAWMNKEIEMPTQARTDEERDKFQEKAVKAMQTAMKSLQSSIKVADNQRRHFLRALYETFGCEGIRYPEHKPGEGPLAYFDRPEEQNAAEADKRFYKTQANLNKTSAKPRTIEEACTALGLAPGANRWSLKNSKRILKSHQVLSLDWALQMITTLGFAYISSDVGLGKTTVAAALILKLLENRTADRVDLTRGSRPTYKPTLILISRDGMLSLFEDLTAFPDITAHQWYGQPGNAIADHAIGTSVEKLIGKLNSLDKYDPVTARQVVVTTYTKFRTMATYIDKSAKGKGKAVDVQPHADEPDEDAEDEEETEEYEGKYQNLVCHVKGRFGIVVLDQAHKAKNPLTRTHVSMSRTYPDQLLGLTSTPTMQSPADLLGFIKLAWQVAASRELVSDIGVHPSRNSYNLLAERLENESITDWPELLPLLHPASFKAHLGYSTSHEKSVTSVEHAQQIDLSAFGLNEVVGGEIPRYKPLVMEFQYDSYQQRKHDKAFKLLMQDRVIGFNDAFYVGWNDHGHINPGVHKELVQLASNCYSGKIVKKLGCISADDVHDLKNSLDGGFRFLQQAIAGMFSIYDDREKRAEFIAGFHP
ncbi:hypothetical protein IWZ03DRAFT_432935 [Phyllosticta citriasiana]|uniref:SNF2 N-terminal domain-containing protein n=1 Tax=Phyllosticta citriasiana TaxID=595635 RepID=A0ABR1KB40_9PEZI